jgi:hypothetical protein
LIPFAGWWSKSRWALQLVAFGALAGATLLVSDSNLGISWKVAVDAVAGTVVILGAFLAGICANQCSSLVSKGWLATLTGSPRPLLGWLAPNLGHWLSAVAGLLTILGLIALSMLLRDFPVSIGPLVVLPYVFSMLLLHTMIGVLIGTFAPSNWAAPTAVCVVLALTFSGGLSMLPGFFQTGGVTGPLTGEGYSLLVLAAMTAIAGGLVGLSSVAVAHGIGLRFRLGWVLVVLAALCVTAWGRFYLPASFSDRFVAIPIEYTCSEGSPRVCLDSESP